MTVEAQTRKSSAASELTKLRSYVDRLENEVLGLTGIVEYGFLSESWGGRAREKAKRVREMIMNDARLK